MLRHQLSEALISLRQPDWLVKLSVRGGPIPTPAINSPLQAPSFYSDKQPFLTLSGRMGCLVRHLAHINQRTGIKEEARTRPS